MHGMRQLGERLFAKDEELLRAFRSCLKPVAAQPVEPQFAPRVARADHAILCDLAQVNQEISQLRNTVIPQGGHDSYFSKLFELKRRRTELRRELHPYGGD